MRKCCALVLMAFVSFCCFGETLEEYLKKPTTVDQYLKEHFGFGIRAEKPEVDARMKDLGFVLENMENESIDHDGVVIKYMFKPKNEDAFLLEGNIIESIVFSYFGGDCPHDEIYEMRIICYTFPESGAKLILSDMEEKWKSIDVKTFDDSYFVKLYDNSGAYFFGVVQVRTFQNGQTLIFQHLTFTNAGA